MPAIVPGDVWMVDLGLAAKVRPCLLLSDYPADNELALVVLVPHTTAVRGNRWEFAANVTFLKPGVFHLQQLDRRLGALPRTVFADLKREIVQLLALDR